MLCRSARSAKPTWCLKRRSFAGTRILQCIRAGFRSPRGGSHATTKQFGALHRLRGAARHTMPLRWHETPERGTGCSLRALCSKEFVEREQIRERSWAATVGIFTRQDTLNARKGVLSLLLEHPSRSLLLQATSVHKTSLPLMLNAPVSD